MSAPDLERSSSMVLLTVNGTPHDFEVENRATLLDTLRETLGLTGAKRGCNHGQCGACTVLLDGKRVLSCILLSVQADRKSVLTIEGLSSSDGGLHPLQQAFIDHDALQCGYCTPGQILSGVACIAEGHAASVLDVREWMSGNLCRCGAYEGIAAAVLHVAASKRMR